MVYDSGVGGLNVFYRLVEAFPNVRFDYLSDGSHCPYGDRCLDEILSLTVDVMSRFIAGGYDGAIIACNTLSTNVLDLIGEKFGLPVFGVLPPALKGEKIALFCTPLTAASPVVTAIRSNVSVFPLKGLAADVERNVFDLDKVSLSTLPEGDFKAVILGCTHYIYMKRCFMKKYPNSTIYDGVDETIGELRRFLGHDVFSVTTELPPKNPTPDNFIGDDKMRNYAVFCRYFSHIVQMF